MRRIIVTCLCILGCAVLWGGCFRSEIRQFIRRAGGAFDPKLVVVAAEFAGTKARGAYAVSAATTSLIMPNAGASHFPIGDSRRFEHLLAYTSSAQAMAPSKSETADSLTTRSQ